MRTAVARASAFALALTACGGALGGGGSAFGEWNDDQGAGAAAAYVRVKDAPVVRGADVAIGVTAGKLVGVPLDGGAKWSVSHSLDARPVLAGGLVVASGGGALFAVDAKTGQKVWSVESEGTLRGAGDDGALTAVTVGVDKGSALVIVDREGKIVRRIATDKSLGTAAIVSGVVFVPWGGQYVSAIDAKTGDEVGRVLVREKSSHAWTYGGHVYFGEVGAFRLDEKTRFASVSRASHVAIPPRELPGTPVWFSPPEEKTPLISGARDRIRLYAQPADSNGTLGLAGGRYYATYFRLAMGFDATRGQLAWVKPLAADVVGGAAGDGMAAMCTADGKVTLFDGKQGGVVRELALGEPIQSCVVQLDGLRAERASAPPVAQQLADALLQKDADLATAQRLLLRELAALEDEIATKVLIDLIVDPKTPVPVAADARTALAARRNGARIMIDALARHYDYLNDVLVAPPSGPIAQALREIKDPAAAAPLASHLVDPATPDADVRQVAAALAVVAKESELGALKQFFAMYQGTAEGEDVESAVVRVARGILRVGGKDGRALVERASARPTTTEGVRAKLKAVLTAKSGGTGGADVADPAPATSAAPAEPHKKPAPPKKK